LPSNDLRQASYTVLKKDGKTKWRNLKTDDKATARRMLADERDADAELDSNLSGLELGQLTTRYLETLASQLRQSWTVPLPLYPER
jgi:hypothetical protein